MVDSRVPLYRSNRSYSRLNVNFQRAAKQRSELSPRRGFCEPWVNHLR